MGRRIGIVLFGLVLFVGLVTGIALAFVTSEPGARWISEKLKMSLREAGMDASFSKLNISLFPPRIGIENLEASGIGFDVGCHVEEAEFSPDPLRLLTGQIAIEEIYLGTPRCRISLSASDMKRFVEASTKTEDLDRAVDFSFLPDFDVVAMSNAAFEIRVDDSEGIGTLSSSIGGLSLDITGRGKGRTHIEIRALLEEMTMNYARGDIVVAESLQGVQIRAALTEQELTIRNLTGALSELELQAREVRIPLPLDREPLTAMYVSVVLPLDMLNRFPVALPSMSGEAGFSGQLSIRMREDAVPDITARGTVRLRRATIDAYTLGDLDSRIALTPMGVSFSETEIRTADGQIRVEGDLAFEEGLRLSANVTLADVELAYLLENLNIANPWVQQRISGDIELSGSLDPLNLSGKLNLDVRDLQVFDEGFRGRRKKSILEVPRITVRGPFRITPEQFTGRGVQVRSGNSRVDADMRFGFNMRSGWDLQVRSDAFDLQDVQNITGFQVAGQGGLTARITAPGYDIPRIVGEAWFRRFRFAGVEASRVKSAVSFDGQRLTFRNMEAYGRQSHLTAESLELDFDAPEGLTVITQVQVVRAEIQDLARSFQVSTQDFGTPGGFISGQLDIDYRETPESLKMDATLTHEGLTLWNEVFGAGAIEGTYEDGALTLRRLDMKKGRGLVDMSGTMSAQGDLNFLALVSDVALQDIVFPAVSDLEVRGTGQIFAVLEGTTAHPEGRATVRVSEITRKGRRFGQSELELRLDGDVLFGRGSFAGRAIILEHGMADLRNNRFSLETFVSDLDVVRFLEMEQEDGSTAMVLSGEMLLEGNLEGPMGLNGEIRLFHAALNAGGIQLRNRETIRMNVQQNQLRLHPARFAGDNVVMDLEGEAGEDQFRLVTRGMINLLSVAELTDVVSRSRGMLGFNVVASGSYDDPSFRGSAEVTGGEFQVDGFPNTIREVNGRVEMGANMIRFVDFSGKSAGGTMDMSGWVSFSGIQIEDYRFRAQLSNLEIQLMEDLSFRLSTIRDGVHLSPGRDGGLPFIGGDIEISHLKYVRDIYIIDIGDLDVAGLGRKRRSVQRPRLFDRAKDVFEYDIRLHGERNLAIVNNLLDTRFRFDDRDEPLRLVGTNQSLGFLGSVIGQGGEVRFAGNTFDIRNAVVTFRDPLRPENPWFRVNADTDIRDWRVSITAEGTVENYEVILTAQPYLPREDIIMLLLTKMIREEHNQFGSTGLSMSLAPLLGNVSAGVIPVEVSVYSEYSEKTGGDTMRVALSRRLTERLWGQVSSSIGESGDVEGLLTYRINENLSVSMSYDNRNESSKTGNWGLDLRFRLEF